MNEEILERLRNPQLRPALRGYDRLEVEALLHDIADLIEARGLGLPEGQKAVGELPGVAERVESIVRSATDAAEHVANEAGKRAAEVTQEADEHAAAVTQEAEQAAEHMRREADGYATETRESADRYAAETRTAAEQEAERLREESARMAEATTAAAEEQATEILREAELERDRVKASILELRQQRQAVVQSIERMRGNLDSMVGDVEKGTEQFIAVGGAAGAATTALDAEPNAETETGPEPLDAECDRDAGDTGDVELHPALEQPAVVEQAVEEEDLEDELDELELEAEAEAELEAEEPITDDAPITDEGPITDEEERRPGEGLTAVVFDDEEEDDDDIVYPTGRDETQPYTTEDFDSVEPASDDEWAEPSERDPDPAGDSGDGATEILELPDDGGRGRS